jgi:hypothetical protein
MAGQLIDCPTCNKPTEIPFPSRVAVVSQTRPLTRNTPTNKTSAQRTITEEAIQKPPSPVLSKPSKTASSRWTLAIILLVLITAGLALGLFFLIKAKSDITIDGEVFIVTKGGQSIKLGLVEVALIPMATLKPYIDRKTTEMANELARIQSEIDATNQAIRRLETEQKTARQKLEESERNRHPVNYSNINEVEFKTAEDAYLLAYHQYWHVKHIFDEAKSKRLQLQSETRQFDSGISYFYKLPIPIRTTKTDSDGKFRLLVPASDRYAIAATVSRLGGDDAEQYYWLIQIDPKDGRNQKFMLSNDNTIASKGTRLLIRDL